MRKMLTEWKKFLDEDARRSSPLVQLNEISQEVYDGVVDAADSLSESELNPLFGDQERVLVPLQAEANEQVQEFYDKIVTPLASKGIKVDLKDGTATKEVETQRGKRERKLRLGKAIGRELPEDTQKWWNKFQADFLGNPDILEAKYGVIITQHPVDVARMSDFSEADIQSCHSQGSDYFRCALADAKRAGAVAYLIDGKDIPRAEEELNDTELFSDRERGVSGITPIGRIRLRRFDNLKLAEEGDALALLVPELRVYGEKVPGFMNTVQNWARGIQENHPVFKKKLNLKDFVLRGGSYQDTPSFNMFNAFVGPENLELNPDLEMYGNDEDTRSEHGEDDIDYDNEQQQMMIASAENQMEEARYHLDHEEVTFDYEIRWDDWNESVEIDYKITIDFDFNFANFMGSPNLGKGSEEELRKAIDRVEPLAAIRDIAEGTYEESEYYNYDIALAFSSDLVDVRMGRGSKPVVRIQMYDQNVTHDPDNFAYDLGREIEEITDNHKEIHREIENALREDGWLIETSFDKLKVDPEEPKKLGGESFENFNISRDDDIIQAEARFSLENYPLTGKRKLTTDFGDTTVMYREGPQLVNIAKADSPLWGKYKGRDTFPPARKQRIIKALKKEITDAAKAATMQPSLPIADLPASKKKGMKGAEMLTPAIDDVIVFLKQTYDSDHSPYRKKGMSQYHAIGGIAFEFEPKSSEEQIQTNLRFIKYFDENVEPIRMALQKEWDDMLANYEKKEVLVSDEKKETNESISKMLRTIIREQINKG